MNCYCRLSLLSESLYCTVQSVSHCPCPTFAHNLHACTFMYSLMFCVAYMHFFLTLCLSGCKTLVPEKRRLFHLWVSNVSKSSLDLTWIGVRKQTLSDRSYLGNKQPSVLAWTINSTVCMTISYFPLTSKRDTKTCTKSVIKAHWKPLHIIHIYLFFFFYVVSFMYTKIKIWPRWHMSASTNGFTNGDQDHLWVWEMSYSWQLIIFIKRYISLWIYDRPARTRKFTNDWKQPGHEYWIGTFSFPRSNAESQWALLMKTWSSEWPFLI